MAICICVTIIFVPIRICLPGRSKRLDIDTGAITDGKVKATAKTQMGDPAMES